MRIFIGYVLGIFAEKYVTVYIIIYGMLVLYNVYCKCSPQANFFLNGGYFDFFPRFLMNKRGYD